MPRPRLIDDDELHAAIVREVDRVWAARRAWQAKERAGLRRHIATVAGEPGVKPVIRRQRLAVLERRLAEPPPAEAVPADFEAILGRRLTALESAACHRAAERLERAGRLVRLRRWGGNVTHVQLVEPTKAKKQTPTA